MAKQRDPLLNPIDDLSRICLLHPGKTGGTYLKSVIRHNRPRWGRPIKLLSHRETLASTAETFGSGRKIAFTFRDPMARFVSAFQSRRRQGRPTYDRMWSPAEAISFMYFDTPNELAEALDSRSEKMKSAAHFAFNSIMHIRTNYAFHFESPQKLADEAGNIVACIDLARFETDLTAFLRRLGISEVVVPETGERHANPEKTEPLSDHAMNNLRKFWAMEFEFYAAFKEIEKSVAG